MSEKKQYPSIEVLKTAVEALKKMDEDENRWQKPLMRCLTVHGVFLVITMSQDTQFVQ